DEMHRPDAAAERKRRGAQPGEARPSLRGADAAAEIEGGIGGERGHRDRERNQKRIVVAAQNHGATLCASREATKLKLTENRPVRSACGDGTPLRTAGHGT